MNDFFTFIEKDIDAKKTLISTMPTKTKTNIKKYNTTIESIEEKYNQYRSSVKNYLLAKSKSFALTDNAEDLNRINNRIIALEHVKFLLNPTNNYFEKMGFDNLLYQLSNYYVFNFKSLTAILNSFLDKFEQAGIYLNSDNFNYTCYVHEYMSSFLNVRNKKEKNYKKTSEIFEQIYWVNPEIIEHIELNLRKLTKDYEKKFTNYIVKLQKEVMAENKIRSYADCLEKLQDAYIERNIINKEDPFDICELAKTGEIDINQYLEESKVRKTAYDSLVSPHVDRNDKDSMDKIYEALEKLKLNIEEYNSYLEFMPLIREFKEEYLSLLPKENAKKDDYKGLKPIESQINQKEKELEKINKKIFSGRPGFFEFKSDTGLKQLKIESVYKANELYTLYKQFEKEYFKYKVLSILNNTMTTSDLLNLYYSFDYFKKLAIQKVFKITTYDEIIKYSDAFDLFAMDPTNIIINGIPVFEERNVARVIANKYKLNSININEEDLDVGNLDILLNRVLLLLRVNVIENSNTDVNKIWFMAQVEKIIAKESKKEEVK